MRGPAATSAPAFASMSAVGLYFASRLLSPGPMPKKLPSTSSWLMPPPP
jgi:hypothetical protein